MHRTPDENENDGSEPASQHQHLPEQVGVRSNRSFTDGQLNWLPGATGESVSLASCTPGLLTVLNYPEGGPKYDSGVLIGCRTLFDAICTLKKRCGAVRPVTGSFAWSPAISQRARCWPNHPARGCLVIAAAKIN